MPDFWQEHLNTSQGARLGQEGPVSIENCLVGPFVELRGGFFREAVFLARASCGLGAHVREGTILEEDASIAHTVGLKQTILFPFVTLGSLINESQGARIGQALAPILQYVDAN